MQTIVGEMMVAAAKSLDRLRVQVSNPRYGKPGIILFEFQGEHYQAPEPTDVMPLCGSEEAARSWCLKQILHKSATKL